MFYLCGVRSTDTIDMNNAMRVFIYNAGIGFNSCTPIPAEHTQHKLMFYITTIRDEDAIILKLKGFSLWVLPDDVLEYTTMIPLIIFNNIPESVKKDVHNLINEAYKQ